MVRFGVIGTGRISDWVLKGAAQDPRIVVTAVCSRTREAAESFIQRNKLARDARIYTSVEPILKSMQSMSALPIRLTVHIPSHA